MKQSASLFRSPALPLLLAFFSASLLGGCYYPYDQQAVLAQPSTVVSTGYYGYYWPGYYSYYGPYYYEPYFYGGFWRSRPLYYYPTPSRGWRPMPGYRPSGPRHQPGWQNRPAGSYRPDSRPSNQGVGAPPANSGGFRSPGGGGGQSHGGGRR